MNDDVNLTTEQIEMLESIVCPTCDGEKMETVLAPSINARHEHSFTLQEVRCTTCNGLGNVFRIKTTD